MKIKYMYVPLMFCLVLAIDVQGADRVINNSGTSIRVVLNNKSLPVVLQSYDSDPAMEMNYVVKKTAAMNLKFNFPQDFVLNIPSVWMRPHTAKRIDQITVLGTHNCFANRDEGFLYYQQLNSSADQFLHGVRMLRPAWHNPSGSFIDKPNTEPILCHADDAKCATISLATRGFKPHHLVKELNATILQLLQAHPQDFLIVGLNNYLDEATTDREIEKVAGLKDLLVTIDDLNNQKNHALWQGYWPTIAWMLQHNKRIFIFNDKGLGTTKYTLNYKNFIRMNQYGTSDIAEAAGMRNAADKVAAPLIELSWFQNISLSHTYQDALNVGVGLFNDVEQAKDRMVLRPLRALGWLKDQIFSISIVGNGFDAMVNLLNKLGILNPFRALTKQFEKYRSSFKDALVDIKNYVPKKQEKSVQELFALINACKQSGTIPAGKVANILMLDFATTEGPTVAFVNLLNILMDRSLGLQFVDVGGFAINGQEIPANLYDNYLDAQSTKNVTTGHATSAVPWRLPRGRVPRSPVSGVPVSGGSLVAEERTLQRDEQMENAEIEALKKKQASLFNFLKND